MHLSAINVFTGRKTGTYGIISPIWIFANILTSRDWKDLINTHHYVSRKSNNAIWIFQSVGHSTMRSNQMCLLLFMQSEYIIRVQQKVLFVQFECIIWSRRLKQTLVCTYVLNWKSNFPSEYMFRKKIDNRALESWLFNTMFDNFRIIEYFLYSVIL